MSSFVFKLFFAKNNKKKKETAPSAADAINRLREVEEILAQKQSYLQHKIQTEMQIIVKNGTKNKRIAVQALKRKKRLESFLAQIDDTIMSLEYQREGLESQQTNIHIFKCLEFANNTLKHIHEGMGGLENAEHMMDDIREQQQCLNHIHYLLSNPGFGAVFDENELMQELDDIQNEENHKLPNIELLPSVPVPPVAAPRSKGIKKEHEDEDELKRLEAWAN